MAYNSSNLSVLSYANGFTQWHYRTEDTASEISEPGYFSKAADMLRLNDCILINASDNNFLLWVTHRALGWK